MDPSKNFKVSLGSINFILAFDLGKFVKIDQKEWECGGKTAEQDDAELAWHCGLTEAATASMVTNSENDLKTGRKDLPRLVRETGPHQKG